MSGLMHKLKKMFTAISLADAGDFDGVKEILRENDTNGDVRQTRAMPGMESPSVACETSAGLSK